MFRNYSFRAGAVLMLARLTAGQRGARRVEVEDLLSGFVMEDKGEFTKLFSDQPATDKFSASGGPQPRRAFLSSALAGELLARLEAVYARSRAVANQSDLPLSKEAQHVLSLAESIRGQLDHTSVEPLHLVAAILEARNSRAAQILATAGITRERVLKSTPWSAGKTRDTPAALDPFTASPSWGRPRLVLALAGLRAWSRGATTIKTGDVLAAVVIEDQGEATVGLPEMRRHPDLLARLKLRSHTPFFTPSLANRLLVGLAALQSASGEEASNEDAGSRCVGIASVELLLQPPPPYALVPLSESAERAFVLGENLRVQLQHSEMQPLHMLAEILDDRSSPSAQIFRDAGITREKVIEFIREAT